MDYINDYLFERFEKYATYLRDKRNVSQSYEYIYSTLSSEKTLVCECQEYLEDKITEPQLVNIILKTVDWTRLMDSLKDYFDYYHIDHCKKCYTYWSMDDSDDEHECK